MWWPIIEQTSNRSVDGGEKRPEERGIERFATLGFCAVLLFHQSALRRSPFSPTQIPVHHTCVYFSARWQAWISNVGPAFCGTARISKHSWSHVWVLILLLPPAQIFRCYQLAEKARSRALLVCPLIVAQSSVLPIWCIIFSFSFYSFPIPLSAFSIYFIKRLLWFNGRQKWRILCEAEGGLILFSHRTCQPASAREFTACHADCLEDTLCPPFVTQLPLLTRHTGL